MIAHGLYFWLKRVVSVNNGVSKGNKRSDSLYGSRPLKPKQLEAVKSFVSGQDTFVALPTGYGKSVIFATNNNNPQLSSIIESMAAFIASEH